MTGPLGTLTRFAIPGGLLAILALGLAWSGLAGEWMTELDPRVAPGVYLLALLLALRFRRTRVASAVLLLALWDRFLPRLAGSDPTGVTTLAAILLALTLGILALARDRGLLTRRGWFQFLAPALLLGIIFLARDYEGEALQRLAQWAPTLRGAPLPGEVLGLTPAAWAGFAGGVALSLLGVLFHRGPIERELFWTLMVATGAMAAGVGTASAGFLFLAGSAVLAVSVVELSYGLAFKDELTGLPSRRALKEALESVRPPYTLAMVDVDHFKRFNDRHGHDVGDQVLRMVASRLGRGRGSRAFRYGGEEFALLYDGSEVPQVKDRLEGVRQAVKDAEFRVRRRTRPAGSPGARGKGGTRGSSRRGGTTRKSESPRSLSVTVSIGAADSRKGDTPEAVLKAADKALYRAKKKGRDRVAT